MSGVPQKLEVKVYELPSADAGTDQALCLNESALLTASGGISYEWDSGDVTSSITVTPLNRPQCKWRGKL